jgi:hypothetical protein
MKKLQILIVILFVSLAISALANFPAKAQTPIIWTEKADYRPGEKRK